jgi:hypothetical protein
MIFNLILILVPSVPFYVYTTKTASKAKKARTPTTVPTNTGIGTAAALRPISARVETDIDDLSVSVAFIEMVVSVVPSSEAVKVLLEVVVCVAPSSEAVKVFL